MRNMLFLRATIVFSLALAGCAANNSACDQTTWTYALINGIPVVGTATTAACVGSSAVRDASYFMSKAERDREAAARPKTFQASPLIQTDISHSPEVLNNVIAAQDKYKAGDFGTSSEAAKVAFVGRYVFGDKAILISNQEKFWLVQYEDEKQVTIKR